MFILILELTVPLISSEYAAPVKIMVQQIVLLVTMCMCKISACKLSHLPVSVFVRVALWSESWGGHVGASYGLDLGDEAELLPV